LSIVLIAAGVALLVGRRAWASTATLLGLASGAFQGGGLLLQQRALEVIGPEELLLYQNAVFLLVMLTWGFFAKADVRRRGPRPVRGWVLAIVSGLLTYVAGEFIKFGALPEASGYVAIAILQLSLPFSVLFALVLLGERVNRRQLLAIGLVFAGSVAGSLGDAW
jgi:drug/metabolite transporter (DMT)-like permease